MADAQRSALDDVVEPRRRRDLLSTCGSDGEKHHGGKACRRKISPTKTSPTKTSPTKTRTIFKHRTSKHHWVSRASAVSAANPKKLARRHDSA